MNSLIKVDDREIIYSSKEDRYLIVCNTCECYSRMIGHCLCYPRSPKELDMEAFDSFHLHFKLLPNKLIEVRNFLNKVHELSKGY